MLYKFKFDVWNENRSMRDGTPHNFWTYAYYNGDYMIWKWSKNGNGCWDVIYVRI